jgi:hypothetical protein
MQLSQSLKKVLALGERIVKENKSPMNIDKNSTLAHTSMTQIGGNTNARVSPKRPQNARNSASTSKTGNKPQTLSPFEAIGQSNNYQERPQQSANKDTKNNDQSHKRAPSTDRMKPPQAGAVTTASASSVNAVARRAIGKSIPGLMPSSPKGPKKVTNMCFYFRFR